MTHSREFHAPCKSGDNAELSVTHTTYREDGEDAAAPDDYISFKTSRGKSVWLLLSDARELAAWLIEHAVEPEPEVTVADQVRQRAANAVRATAGPMVGGGGGMGVFAGQGGAGGHGYGGGQGGAGGSATIVQRTV